MTDVTSTTPTAEVTEKLKATSLSSNGAGTAVTLDELQSFEDTVTLLPAELQAQVRETKEFLEKICASVVAKPPRGYPKEKDGVKYWECPPMKPDWLLPGIVLTTRFTNPAGPEVMLSKMLEIQISEKIMNHAKDVNGAARLRQFGKYCHLSYLTLNPPIIDRRHMAFVGMQYLREDGSQVCMVVPILNCETPEMFKTDKTVYRLSTRELVIATPLKDGSLQVTKIHYTHLGGRPSAFTLRAAKGKPKENARKRTVAMRNWMSGDLRLPAEKLIV